jgi:diadenylate cyclase
VILLFRIGFLELSWVDVVDILAVTILLYQLYKLMKAALPPRYFSAFSFSISPT